MSSQAAFSNSFSNRVDSFSQSHMTIAGNNLMTANDSLDIGRRQQVSSRSPR